MGVANLVVSSADPIHLYVSDNAEDRDSVIGALKSYRISPIFPVDQSCALPNVATFRVSFFVLSRGLASIGRIGQLGKVVLGKLWFSNGLASLIAFNLDDSELFEIESNFSDDIRAMEIWAVRDHLVTCERIALCEPDHFDAREFRVIEARGNVDADTLHLLADLRHGIDTLLPLVAQYTPLMFPLGSRMVKQINDLSSEINDDFAILKSASEGGDSPLLDATQKHINTMTDQLIQLNSVLSYAISQSFGGTIPLLKSPSLIHSHSFLGVGTAVLALYSVLQCVDKAFQKTPVYTIVKQAFGTAQPFDVFTSLKDVDVTAWKDQPSRVDFLIDSLPLSPDPPRPHVMFFSGRLGFQEAVNSISAANQALSAADSVRRMARELL
jgi:hypothetical protein